MTEGNWDSYATALIPAFESVLRSVSRADRRLRSHVTVIPSQVYDFSILGWLTHMGDDDEVLVISANKALGKPFWTADVVDRESRFVAEAGWPEATQASMSADAEVARKEISRFLNASQEAMVTALRGGRSHLG